MDAADHMPWSVLDDGWVVLTIFDVRIAFPTCAMCLEYRFRTATARCSVSDRCAPSVRDAIAHPERLRYFADSSDKTKFELWNNWQPKYRMFLVQIDVKLLPWMRYLHLFLYKHSLLYKHSRANPCWNDLQPDMEYLAVHNVDLFARRDGQIIDSMNVIRKPFRYFPADKGIFTLSGGYSFYLASTGHARDAVGLPVCLECDLLKLRNNSMFHIGGGFALRRDANLFFTFREERYALVQRRTVATAEVPCVTA